MICDGRRPSVRQLVSSWKREGSPGIFSVTYEDTYALFENVAFGWETSGHGDAIDRAAMLKSLAEGSRIKFVDERI